MTHEENNSSKGNVLIELKGVLSEKAQVQEELLKTRHADTFFLYFVALTAQLLALTLGASITWTSPALLALTSNNPDVNPIGRPITAVEVSLIAGLPIIFILVGSVIQKLADVIGRKKHLQIMGCITLLSGIALSFCNNIILMITFNCIKTIALSSSVGVVQIYVTEICEDHNRAKFGCFFGLLFQMGNFFCYILAPVFSFRYLSLMITTPSILFLIFAFLIPESIFYLASKGRETECKKALRKLRNNKTEEELTKDFNEMKEIVNSRTKAEHSSVMYLFKKKEHRVALMLTLLPLLVQVLSGIEVLMAFLAPIFDSANINLSGNNAAILVASVKIICFLFTSFIVEKLGRRIMLLVSSFGTAITLFPLGLFFLLRDTNSPLIGNLQWLPVLGMMLIVVMFSLGIGPIPFAIMTELFPTDLKTNANCFMGVFHGVVLFSIVINFPLVAEAFGIHWCFWIFSCCCFIGGVLIYFFLPEMKGKSFIEIQKILREY